jgi:hypothetical protein
MTVRSHLRGRGVTPLVTVVAAGSLALGACGGSGARTTSSIRNGSAPTAAAGRLSDLLTEQGVEQDTAFSRVSATTDVATARSAVMNLHDALAADDASLGRLRLSGPAAGDLKALIGVDDRYVTGLTTVTAAADVQALTSQLYALQSTLIDDSPSAAKLAKDLGVKEPWMETRPVVRTVYTDNFTTTTTFSTSQGPGGAVTEGGGHLTFSVVPQHVIRTYPTATHAFDGAHVTTQVDATPSTGDALLSYGLVCPHVKQQSAVIVIIGGGKYAIGVVDHANALRLYVPFDAASAIRTGTATNHLSLDCDQYAPGITTVRLAVNGMHVDTVSVPGDLPVDETEPGNIDPGVVVANSTPTGVGVVFANWSVSAIGPPPPVPVPIPPLSS